MTREEAIKVLEEFQVIDDWTMVYLPPMEDAVNMAIKALSAEVVQPLVLTCDGCRHVGTYDTDFPCSGCIRREKDYYEQER